jgi:hypothetical protein
MPFKKLLRDPFKQDLVRARRRLLRPQARHWSRKRISAAISCVPSTFLLPLKAVQNGFNFSTSAADRATLPAAWPNPVITSLVSTAAAACCVLPEKLSAPRNATLSFQSLTLRRSFHLPTPRFDYTYATGVIYWVEHIMRYPAGDGSRHAAIRHRRFS